MSYNRSPMRNNLLTYDELSHIRKVNENGNFIGVNRFNRNNRRRSKPTLSDIFSDIETSEDEKVGDEYNTVRFKAEDNSEDNSEDNIQKAENYENMYVYRPTVDMIFNKDNQKNLKKWSIYEKKHKRS